ncbi:hypothetical protein [Streptomyces sp. NPDC056296]|uniref:hypothetical protein n=1 Tax=Streptomyces sp. NPDC056296 TaxID=3345775 RepID=UPI0035E2012D
MIYAFIEAEKTTHTVALLCRLLRGSLEGCCSAQAVSEGVPRGRGDWRRRHRQDRCLARAACTKHRTGRLPRDRARLVVALVDGDWTPEAAAYAVLAWTPAFSGA